jgi:hypothetical protein
MTRQINLEAGQVWVRPRAKNGRYYSPRRIERISETGFVGFRHGPAEQLAWWIAPMFVQWIERNGATLTEGVAI